MKSNAAKTQVTTIKNQHKYSVHVICILVIMGAAIAAFDSPLQHIFESILMPEPLLAVTIIGLHLTVYGLYSSAGSVLACFADVMMEMFFGLPLLNRKDVFLLLAFFAMIVVCHLFMYRLFHLKKTFLVLPVITIAALFLSVWICNVGRIMLNPGSNWLMLLPGAIVTCILLLLIRLHGKREKIHFSIKY